MYYPKKITYFVSNYHMTLCIQFSKNKLFARNYYIVHAYVYISEFWKKFQHGNISWEKSCDSRVLGLIRL